MAVYVDDMYAEFGRMKMCHMIADTSEELHAMAAKIGVQRKWCQYPGTYREHYDIAMSKRALAVSNGAKEITWGELGRMEYNRNPRRQREATVQSDDKTGNQDGGGSHGTS